MNFSKYRLQKYLSEGQAVSGGTQTSLDASNKGTEAASMGRERATGDKQVSNERQRRMRAQKADPRGAGQVFEDLRKKVEHIKSYESQKSDWRSELQEKVIDGQEREKHPFVTVMPTGDENMIQALKQMGKGLKDKKDDIKEGCNDGCDCDKCKKESKKKKLDENRRAARSAGGYKDDSKKQPDPSKDGFTGVGNMSIKDIMKMNKDIEKRTKKEEVDLEEKKKECKDGYTYNSDTKQCEKKKKSKSTTNIFIGGRYGGHHDHDEDDSDDNDNSGGDGGGEGGGMGEAFELMGQLLEMDLDTYQKKFGKKQPKPFDPEARSKQRGAQVKQMVKNTKRSKDDKETGGRYP